MKVWLVFTEWGDYEQWSRDLRGVFATEELAEAHRDQLAASKEFDVCEVVAEDVLGSAPSAVTLYRRSAHIEPNGSESRGLGYQDGIYFGTWDNEYGSLHKAELGSWSGQENPDLHIEVLGTDRGLVLERYAELLTEARERLGVT